MSWTKTIRICQFGVDAWWYMQMNKKCVETLESFGVTLVWVSCWMLVEVSNQTFPQDISNSKIRKTKLHILRITTSKLFFSTLVKKCNITIIRVRIFELRLEWKLTTIKWRVKSLFSVSSKLNEYSNAISCVEPIPSPPSIDLTTRETLFQEPKYHA